MLTRKQAKKYFRVSLVMWTFGLCLIAFTHSEILGAVVSITYMALILAVLNARGQVVIIKHQKRIIKLLEGKQ